MIADVCSIGSRFFFGNVGSAIRYKNHLEQDCGRKWDGIMGIPSPWKDANRTQSPFTDSLFNLLPQKLISFHYSHAFGLNFYEHHGYTVPSGEISFGGINSHASQLLCQIPLINGSSYWRVAFLGISWMAADNDMMLRHGSGSADFISTNGLPTAAVDTGAHFTYIQPRVFDILNQFMDSTPDDLLEFIIDCQRAKKLPSIQLRFSSFNLTLKGSQLYYVDNGKCISVFRRNDYPDSEMLIGSSILRYFVTTFDYTNEQIILHSDDTTMWL